MSEEEKSKKDGPALDRGDVHLIEIDGRQIQLVGTAHVSQRSVDLVHEVIQREQPDAVCIELDSGRFEALSHEKRFEEQRATLDHCSSGGANTGRQLSSTAAGV